MVRTSAAVCHQVHLLRLPPQALQTQRARDRHAPCTGPSYSHISRVSNQFIPYALLSHYWSQGSVQFFSLPSTLLETGLPEGYQETRIHHPPVPAVSPSSSRCSEVCVSCSFNHPSLSPSPGTHSPSVSCKTRCPAPRRGCWGLVFQLAASESQSLNLHQCHGQALRLGRAVVFPAYLFESQEGKAEALAGARCRSSEAEERHMSGVTQ